MIGPAQRKLIFDAAKRRGAKFASLADVRDMDAAIDAAMGAAGNDNAVVAAVQAPVAAPAGRQVSPRGIAQMHEFETCKLAAYPDPGSKDGHPWTIGWGATGPGIARGVTWTQAQCDARFAVDVASFAAKVELLIGDSFTDQSMFDAMVSLTYNIGVGTTNPKLPGGFTRSTVRKKHRAGDHAGAAAAFGMWIKNDGKVMRGLVRRRAAEAALYLADG